MSTAIIIIDVQKGFINSHTRRIPVIAEHLLRHGQHDSRILTQFFNSPTSPFCRVLGWSGMSCEPDTQLCDGLGELADKVFSKSSYSSLSGTALLSYLQDNFIKEVHLCGVDTDASVLATALALFDAGIRPVILADCCASSAGGLIHEAAISILVRSIGESQFSQIPQHFSIFLLFHDDT